MNTALIVNDLVYGDAGKGTMVDYFTSQSDFKQVVRFSGGSQAAHNVITNDGRHHKFSQLGAGSFNGAKTHISKGMLVDPIMFLDEVDIFNRKNKGKEVLNDITIDENCIVITPYQVRANRINENFRAAFGGRHGSCGMGIGETRKDYFKGLFVSVKDIINDNFEGKLKEIKDSKAKEISSSEWDKIPFENICSIYREFSSKIKVSKLDINKNLVFEGAQGFLLDETYGFHPHNTWTDVSFSNALEDLKGFNGNIKKIGVIRSYMTRHGDGPLVTEDKSLVREEKHNKINAWQGGWRLGHLDLVAIRYAIEYGRGIDELIITHFDKIEKVNKVCIDYTGIDKEFYENGRIKFQGITDSLSKNLFKTSPIYEEVKKDNFIDFIEKFLDVKVKIVSNGPTLNDKIEF